MPWELLSRGVAVALAATHVPAGAMSSRRCSIPLSALGGPPPRRGQCDYEEARMRSSATGEKRRYVLQSRLLGEIYIYIT